MLVDFGGLLQHFHGLVDFAQSQQPSRRLRYEPDAVKGASARLQFCFLYNLLDNTVYRILPVQHQEEHGRQRDAPLQQPPALGYVSDAGNNYVTHRHR